MGFRLLSYKTNAGDAPRAGILIDDHVIDLAANCRTDAFDASSVLSVVQNWDAALALLEAVSGDGTPLADVTLTAPILYPTNIFCAAANYQDHFREMTGHDVDKSTINPYFFNKVANQTVIGTGENIQKPHITEKMDWEAEIAVVIGRPGRNILAADAMDHVAGYCIINDLSARDYLNREDWPSMRSDWLWQKSFDTSAPMGPWITPKSEIADPQNLSLQTWVNGELKQDSHSKWMVFTIAEQIEALSEHFTLLAGDVIASGTGSGVGHPNATYLNAGDVCRIEIEGLGGIDNPIIKGA